MKAKALCRAFLAPLFLLASTLALAADPSLELNVELDPGSRRFKAVALVTPESRDFRFELHESLAVTAASIGGKPLRIPAAGRRGPFRQWRVVLPEEGEKLRLEYGGTLPALDRNLDHRDVLQGLPPMASREGSFLPAGSAWYPQPAALFTYRVSLSVPADQRALVPGRLESENLPAEPSGRYRASFEFTHPVDGIDLMAGPWVVREKMVGRSDGSLLRLRTYFLPDLDAIPSLADGYLADTQRYLERYSEEIGAYPFSEFSVVASPLPTGFGMPTLTYLGADVLRLPFIRATSLGHEVLHNWWGNGVYVDYARGNWSEGLTTFMADYAYKEDESPVAAREMRLGWLRDFAALPPGSGQSLAAFRSRTHGAAAAVGYGKAAMVFVMLRDLIGQDAFQRGLRSFWEQQRFRTAAWEDLQAAFEQAARQPLGSFFDQWVNRVGGPLVRITRAQARPAPGGKARLALTVEQSAAPYGLHLPIQTIFPGGTDMRWVDVQGKVNPVVLEVSGIPQGVRLDPELRVWRLLDREQLPPILRQWIIASSPRWTLVSREGEVREAADTLAKRFFETPPRLMPGEGPDGGQGPLLLVGLHADVDAALARAGLPPRPADLDGRGTAQVWTIQRQEGGPVAVVSARDAASLRALLRPLPHYGSQSWLVFEGGRAVDKGVWPAPGPVIPVEVRP